MPLASHILCALSGGADSVALAALLARYGKRVIGKGGLSFIHINHGWRGLESDGDEAFCRELAATWGVPLVVERLAPVAGDTGPARGALLAPKGQSPEDAARRARKAVFERHARAAHGGDIGGESSAVVLTAHHADDVAETVLWRVLSGQAARGGAGIRAREGVELRPLLGVRRAELRAFLAEEGLSWREDATNGDPRFLRARMRRELLPVVEALFPRAVGHLCDLARGATARGGGAPGGEAVHAGERALAEFFRDQGLQLRAGAWREIGKGAARVDLPGGWRLERGQQNKG